jgi:hypothetical protein
MTIEEGLRAEISALWEALAVSQGERDSWERQALVNAAGLMHLYESQNRLQTEIMQVNQVLREEGILSLNREPLYLTVKHLRIKLRNEIGDVLIAKERVHASLEEAQAENVELRAERSAVWEALAQAQGERDIWQMNALANGQSNIRAHETVGRLSTEIALTNQVLRDATLSYGLNAPLNIRVQHCINILNEQVANARRATDHTRWVAENALCVAETRIDELKDERSALWEALALAQGQAEAYLKENRILGYETQAHMILAVQQQAAHLACDAEKWAVENALRNAELRIKQLEDERSAVWEALTVSEGERERLYDLNTKAGRELVYWTTEYAVAMDLRQQALHKRMSFASAYEKVSSENARLSAENTELRAERSAVWEALIVAEHKQDAYRRLSVHVSGDLAYWIGAHAIAIERRTTAQEERNTFAAANEKLQAENAELRSERSAVWEVLHIALGERDQALAENTELGNVDQAYEWRLINLRNEVDGVKGILRTCGIHEQSAYAGIKALVTKHNSDMSGTTRERHTLTTRCERLHSKNQILIVDRNRLRERAEAGEKSHAKQLAAMRDEITAVWEALIVSNTQLEKATTHSQNLAAVNNSDWLSFYTQNYQEFAIRALLRETVPSMASPLETMDLLKQLIAQRDIARGAEAKWAMYFATQTNQLVAISDEATAAWCALTEAIGQRDLLHEENRQLGGMVFNLQTQVGYLTQSLMAIIRTLTGLPLNLFGKPEEMVQKLENEYLKLRLRAITAERALAEQTWVIQEQNVAVQAYIANNLGLTAKKFMGDSFRVLMKTISPDIDVLAKYYEQRIRSEAFATAADVVRNEMDNGTFKLGPRLYQVFVDMARTAAKRAER